MYEAMWHDITNQTGGNISAVTIPVMFGRCVLNIISKLAFYLKKIISKPIYMIVDCINFILHVQVS